MCGIAGFSGAGDPHLLAQMSAAMAHRGPDDVGDWFDESSATGLCHRRLAIIDLSPRGHQPMWDGSGRYAIVFNGEIYNYRELRHELEPRFHFASESDTEVLLHLYARDGEAMLERLNGIFAFAIWDRERESLFVARDAMGVKPLYYAEAPGMFAFGSLLRSLLCLPLVSTALDLRAMLDYLTLLYSPAPATMFQAIRKLEPGHALMVRGGQVHRKWRWYELPYEADQLAVTLEDAALELRAHLETAVRRQMVSDVPVGAFLSGGVDSSALTAFARNSADVECFTVAFRDDAWGREGMTDDLPYARSVAQHLGVRLNVVGVGAEIVEDLGDMVYHLEEPQADMAAVHVRAICSRARQMGIKVLLSGTGGDDLFSGYRRHSALAAERYWRWLPQVARKGLSSSVGTLSVARPAARRAAKAMRYADREEPERIARYFEWLEPQRRSALLSDAARSELAGHLNRVPLLQTIQALPATLSSLQQMLYLEQKFFLTDHNLNYTDKMSMAEGVEVRVPFLDADLVRFSWSLPDSVKIGGGDVKRVLKHAVAPFLPPAIVKRPKSGFGVPLRRWIHNELRDYVQDHLAPATIRGRGLFDADAVQQLIQQDRNGVVDGAYPILSMLCIEAWCRLFVDGGWKQRVAASHNQAPVCC